MHTFSSRIIVLFCLFAIISIDATAQRRQNNKYTENIYHIGNATYILREIPSRYMILFQDSSNVWLKDSLNWGATPLTSPEIYKKIVVAEPIINVDSTLLFQVFRKDPKRLAALKESEQPLLYHCIIDKNGRIKEVMFDIPPDSQLTISELYRIEQGLKLTVQFEFEFEDKKDNLENIMANYFFQSNLYIEFKKVKNFDMRTLWHHE